MKKILLSMMILTSGAALAADVNNNGREDTHEVGQQTRHEAHKANKEMKKESHEMKEEAKKDQKELQQDKLFQATNAFTVSGKIKDRDTGDITILRQGLPDAKLDLRDQTKIFIDGKLATVQDLKEGDVVHCKFQLDGDKPLAVRIDAKVNKGVGGSGMNQGIEGKSKKKEKKDEKKKDETKKEEMKKGDDANKTGDTGTPNE